MSGQDLPVTPIHHLTLRGCLKLFLRSWVVRLLCRQDPGSRLDYFLAAASRWVLPKRRRTGGAAAGCGRPRCVWVQVPPAATPMAPARLHAGIHRRRAAGLNADDDATP
ncbi:g5821 [Coccomyxa elongata]